MSNLPSITVIGNVTRDPEIRWTSSGKPWISVGVACTERRKTDAGDWENGDTSYFDILAYGQTAENIAESIRKGHRVTATGRVRVRRYETKDGGRGSATEVVADDVAVSLRWAQVSVNRVSRDAGDRSAGIASSSNNDPWASDPAQSPF